MNTVVGVIQRLWQQHKKDIIIATFIFLAAIVPRFVDLGAFLTADEKNWIGRSYEFIRAFKDVRFNDMLQTTHPGVTTMWLSGIAVTLKMLISHIPFSFRNIAHFVTAAQAPIALANAFVVPMAYIFLRRLFGGSRRIPIAAALFIAFDPFIVGYSRVAHVDALLAGFLFLACLAIIIYAKSGYGRVWLVISAVLAALALLTKAPAVFVVPFFGLTVLMFEGTRLVRKDVFIARARDAVIWMLLILLIILALWPAILWVPNPEGNVLLLKRDIGRAAITPHHMSEDYTVRTWYYPATLLTRTSIPVLVFASVFVLYELVMLARWWGGRTRREFDAVWLLLLGYVFFFTVMMTLGAKKGDRYLLPVYPAINVIAVLGVGVSARLLLGNARMRKHIVRGVYAVVVVYLAGVVWWYHPYAIAYSNPLFPDNLSQELGWGEGLEQVGAWLSQNAPDAVVASWYPEELGAYTSAHVAHINAHEQGKVRYVVLYRNMFGRAPDHYANDFIDRYYNKREPVFVARVAGKEFAWVFEKRVYERIIGEMTRGVRIGQRISVTHENPTAIEVLVATYSGTAPRGRGRRCS